MASIVVRHHMCFHQLCAEPTLDCLIIKEKVFQSDSIAGQFNKGVIKF